MVKSIQYRSPGITVIMLQYVCPDVQTIFILYLIVIHVAPYEAQSRIRWVRSILIIGL